MMEMEVGWQSDEDNIGDAADQWDDSNQSLTNVGHKASLKLEVEEYSPPFSLPGPSRKQVIPVELQCKDGNMHESCYKKGETTTGVYVTSSTNFDLQCEDETVELCSEHSGDAQGDLSDEEVGDDDENIIKAEAFEGEDLELISGAALPYCCKRCGICFQDLSGLQEHKQIHSGEHSYCCHICGKEFFHAANLQIHKLIHSSNRPHKCPECDKGFIRASDVWHHLRNVHKIERSNVILGCSVVRNYWSTKHNHLVAREDGQKPGEEPRTYICPTCDKGFRKASLLYKHKMIHRKDKPYKCQECGMAFVLQERLKRHLQTHSGVRPFHCEECGRTFTRLDSLQCHQRIHTGEKPYACAECLQTFTVMCSLRRHEQTHKVANPRGSQPRDCALLSLCS